MPDDKSKTGNPDRQRINTAEAYEVRDWAKKFQVSHHALRKAVEAVGNSAEAVRKHLGK